MKVLSVVCAREGSKGAKNKCARVIDNIMIAEYAIRYSLSLGKNIKTVVSTDIEKLIRACKINNIDYIKRKPALCRDKSRITDALLDAIEKKGRGCDYCSLVYGNIPTRYPKLFHQALNFLETNSDYEAVISMQKVEKFHPDWMFNFDTELIPKKEEISYRRQGLSQKMIHDGHTLVFKINEFYGRSKGLIKYDKRCMYSIFGAKIKPLINNEIIIDIDTEKDLKLAEKVILNK